MNYDDLFISSIYSIGTFFNVASNFLAAYLWNKFGFDITFLTLIALNLSNLVAITISKNYFIIEILFGRAAYGYLLIFQDLFCYTLFDTQEAMKYVKLFVLYNTLGNFV